MLLVMGKYGIRCTPTDPLERYQPSRPFVVSSKITTQRRTPLEILLLVSFLFLFLIFVGAETHTHTT